MTLLTPAQTRVLQALKERDARERKDGSQDPLRLRAVSETVARLLYLLVIQKRARTIVEFGTSHGYSTIHLAAAAEHTGGRVYSVDAIPEKTAFARKNLKSAGLDRDVELSTSDGLDFARAVPNSIDFVFVDYGIPAFAPVFPVLRQKLTSGCLLFVDAGPPGCWETDDASRAFKESLERSPDYIVTLLPMHKEELLAVRL
jgi:predicted O-methyltransferase YrrM